ncbi:MAG: nickel-dependent hydrogenase large subunit [Nitrosomonadales bacterium]|nr:nickel-dependent hydrogenase large subunit [Nitrosomonadales bacterium]
MFDVGKLTLGVVWDGESVAATDIGSTRPMAARVLKGKTPTQVLQIVPLLFSVCGRAQGAAASAAMLAAMREQSPAVATMQHTIVCEALQEHLWRAMLDWPELLGLPQEDKQFAGWYSMLRKIGAGETGMEVFRQEFERDGLGMPIAEWLALDSYAAMQSWWRKPGSALARPLAKLDELAQSRCSRNEVRLLPAWSAAEVEQACAGRWDAAFAARPDWQGVAAETGAWSYYADSPLLRDVWQQSGSKALTRLLARMVDMARMANGDAANRLDMTSPAADEGIAVVRTARGLLLHRVLLEGDKVADYAIVAPTEWNFHPAGAFAQDLCGLAEHDGGLLEYRAQIEAMSLDPCVAYEIEIRNSDA